MCSRPDRSSEAYPPTVGVLAQAWLLNLDHAQSLERYQSEALRSLRDQGLASAAWLYTIRHAAWQPVAWVGAADATPPVELLAEALDQDRLVRTADWLARAMLAPSDLPLVLALRRDPQNIPLAEPTWDQVVRMLSNGIDLLRACQHQAHRLQRQEAMLAIAARWHRTLDTGQLLEQIAEASTQLLAAERASIFLWDRRHKMLVARPALGVPGGELRIPDDRGVVGQVVQTGQLCRVDRQAGQQWIDRRTDHQLGFQTRTLLCVPLLRTNGDVMGAFELINKHQGDFTAEDEKALTELAKHAADALQKSQQFEQVLASRRQLAAQAAEEVEWIGTSPVIQTLRATVARVAPTDLAVLLVGENGTGKEVVSRSIHYLSPRRDEPFIAVNCAAITETLLESELFGHERGAFTDAHQTRAGKFELACGGTLFLDEIGDLSLGGQAKLLRVLEEKTIVRVGGSHPISIDVRVIAATNHDLATMVQAGRFREDLFFRLQVVTLALPPLRDRGADILLLAEHFLQEFCARAHRPVPQLTHAARERLLRHPWPGNVRELRNVMERIAYLSESHEVDVAELAFVLGEPASPARMTISELPLSAATQRFQTDYIREQIARAGGNVSVAAQRLGLHRANLYRKMRQLGIPTDEDAPGQPGG